MTDTAEALRERAAELELELATLEAELEAFHADYLRAVGMLVAEVHALEAHIAAASGDPVAAATAEERAHRSRADLAAVPPPAAPPPTEDLKALFRRAAKLMHPDLVAESERPHAEAFMKRANAAYRRGDASTLADLLRQWEGAVRPDAADELAAAQAAVASAERRLATARASDVARLLEASIAASLRGEDLLAELRARWEAALADARARLGAQTWSH